jgi:catechol 2,3-dioxygenase-like lactoylglutathione lyase family enzyme
MRFRRQTRLIATLAARCLAMLAAPSAQTRVHSVSGVSSAVADMERSVRFYSQVLTFEKMTDQERDGTRVVRMKLGDETIELVQLKGQRGQPLPADSRSNDLWFQHIAIIVSNIGPAYEVLRKHGVEAVSQGPQRLPDWNRNAAGIRAFYFKDPDGHPLEILQFPAGKGDPKWQRGGRLFLGIDHTAIVVADTAASLKFYSGMGFRVAGEGENYGPEQERLNNVAGAHLRITTLRAGSGPGIELLEYLHPCDGRRLPHPLAHRQTILTAIGSATPEQTLTDPNGHQLLVRVADNITSGELR